MRVYEVAREFEIEAEKLMQLLRTLGARVQSEASLVDDATVAKLRARFERERRAGHVDVEESLEAVIEHSHPSTRRRRRRKLDIEPVAEELVEAEADTPITEVAGVDESVEAPAGEEASPPPAIEIELPAEEELAPAAEAESEPVVAEAVPEPVVEPEEAADEPEIAPVPEPERPAALTPAASAR
ncbi:MAG: hypothetical protein ACRELX_07635, partial [Longimicrobiales bacterium]